MKYQLYAIDFLDHNMTNGEAMHPTYCHVVGYLVKEDRHAYYLTFWVTDNNVLNSDSEVLTILKSTILRKKRIKWNG